ncbi:MAG: class I SAM-dependent methyltransferase, partial [Pseudomonadales bacterium]
MYLDLLEKGVRHGIIHLRFPNGKSYQFGDHGLEAHWTIKSQEVIRRIARDWEWELGETYMHGGWDAADGQLHDLLYILRANFATYRVNRWLQPIIKLLLQWNKVSRSYHNVEHHYDLGNEFFRLFLDKDMHYSCAYFCSEDETLEQAQVAKCRHISQKLLLQPGQRVLDIGCGWGSLACYL